jgi:hypothetical protein
MIRRVPTPDRASREASDEPVAPQPAIATRAWESFSCPWRPIPENSICREYRSFEASFEVAFEEALKAALDPAFVSGFIFVLLFATHS